MSRRLRRGALLVDLMFGVFVLAMAATTFFALFPTVHRSQQIAKEEAIAQQMSQRMLEQLQLLKPSDITPGTLSQLNLIDPNQTQPPYSFTNIPLDAGWRFSPAQALRNGTGTLTVTQLDASSVRLAITIGWKSSSGKSSSITTGTILGGYR
ncbi:MAG TPA: hypothetical protein PLH94_08535 [Fimbriimonadaceae bacterium]|nr:hypothetical protein [Fimbriimonadaceae bacterium]